MLTVAAADIAKVISVLFSLSWAHFLDTGMIIGADLSPRNRARRHTHWVWVSTRGGFRRAALLRHAADMMGIGSTSQSAGFTGVVGCAELVIDRPGDTHRIPIRRLCKNKQNMP